MSAVVIGIAAMAWGVSADREYRDKMPEVRHESLAADRQLEGAV